MFQLKIAVLAPVLLVALLSHVVHGQRLVLESDSLAVAASLLVLPHVVPSQLAVHSLSLKRAAASHHVAVVDLAIHAAEVDDFTVCSLDCQLVVCSHGYKQVSFFHGSNACVVAGPKIQF